MGNSIYAWLLYKLFIPYFIIYCLITLHNFYKSYKKGDKIAKAQIVFVVLGLLGACVIGIVTNLLLPLFGESKLSVLGPSFAIPFLASFNTYDILKHHLFSIKVVNVTDCNLTLRLQLFIEGFYSGNSTMKALLFNDGLTNDSTACDSITVELHQAISPFNIVESYTCLLHTNGIAEAIFSPATINGSYYIAIRHKNCIEVWSKAPLLFNSSVINFDLAH